MSRFTKKLKYAKAALIAWNKIRVGNAVTRVQEVKQTVDTIQTSLQANPLNAGLIQEERRAIRELVKVSIAEESYMKQRSRDTTITLRDSNTSYFFKSVRRGR
ncbi:hypothetical protein FRX31_009664 [Thalictrum thalictroides]|uniref:Uncharacterized protein n=1 Tax=Thalictrum thalictroides TaxID=46969 RepID=A0A7J6WVI5_THATH|nr:hypothetical protein FRX31_009664 [Thalictrum thalictroides]